MSSNNIYSSTQAYPYVYVCTHKTTGQFYIGYREQNVKLGLPSTVDFPKYKTSSNLVKPHFSDYDWQIVAEFFLGDDAFEFEQKLIKEHWGNELLLNEQYRLPAGDKAFKTKKGHLKGKKNPALSLRNKNTVPWNKGLTKDDPRVAKYAKPRSEEFKAARSAQITEWHKTHDVSGKNNSMFGVTRKRVVCEHCGKDTTDAAYGRAHGAKCKALKS
jgi:hypothetical protein